MKNTGSATNLITQISKGYLFIYFALFKTMVSGAGASRPEWRYAGAGQEEIQLGQLSSGASHHQPSGKHTDSCRKKHILFQKCSILFYPILLSSILFCSVLFCSVLFCSVLFCSVLFCSVLFYSIIFCSILSYSILFLFYYILFNPVFILFCSVLFFLFYSFYSIQFCSILFDSILFYSIKSLCIVQRLMYFCSGWHSLKKVHQL